MAIILQISSEELEKLRALVLAKYRSNRVNPNFKVNSYKPNYTQLLKDIQNSVPQCSESAGLSRLVKLLFFTNPSICEPSQMKPVSFGSDFIDCCYLYATNGSFNRDSFLLKNKGTKEKSFPDRKLILGVLASLIILSAAYFILLNQKSNINTDEEKSIAVLPFVDMSPEGNQEYLGDGIAEEVRNTLSKYENLKVIARTSSFQFRGEKVDIREVGEKLGVGYVVEGSVRKFGDQIRVTAQLINANDGSHIWSDNWDRVFSDLFAIQDEIASSISKQLQRSLGITPLINTRGTDNMEAYEYYLKAEHLHSQYYSDSQEEPFLIADSFYQKVIELDSTFAEAHAGLSNLYDTRFSYKNDSIYRRMARIESDIAFQLNPESSYVNLVKACVHKRADEYKEAHHYYIKAIELDQQKAFDAYVDLGILLFEMGLYHEASSANG